MVGSDDNFVQSKVLEFLFIYLFILVDGLCIPEFIQDPGANTTLFEKGYVVSLMVTGIKMLFIYCIHNMARPSAAHASSQLQGHCFRTDSEEEYHLLSHAQYSLQLYTLSLEVFPLRG